MSVRAVFRSAALVFALVAALAASPVVRAARQPDAAAATTAATTATSTTAGTEEGVDLPPDYVIGPEDVLSVVFWREKDMSTEAAVRPDGKITLPLLNDIEAAGKTPEQLRGDIAEAAGRFIEDPAVTVVVKQINSRKVFITGMVGKPGVYPLTGPMTVLQLISMAGGLHEFASEKNITINRIENGRQIALKFNYKDVQKGKNLKQNIELKPGDTVVVP